MNKTHWVDPKPVKTKYIPPLLYSNLKYTRPIFYLNPNTPDPYLTRPPELTGLMLTFPPLTKAFISVVTPYQYLVQLLQNWC